MCIRDSVSKGLHPSKKGVALSAPRPLRRYLQERHAIWGDAHAAARSVATAAADPQATASIAANAAPATRVREAFSAVSCRPETVGNGSGSTLVHAISQETVGNCADPLDELAAMEAAEAAAAAAASDDGLNAHPSSNTPLPGAENTTISCTTAIVADACDDEEDGEFGYDYDMGPAAYV